MTEMSMIILCGLQQMNKHTKL